MPLSGCHGFQLLALCWPCLRAVQNLHMCCLWIRCPELLTQCVVVQQNQMEQVICNFIGFISFWIKKQQQKKDLGILISNCLFSSLPSLPHTLPLVFYISGHFFIDFCVITCLSFSYIGQTNNYRIILLAGSQLHNKKSGCHSTWSSALCTSALYVILCWQWGSVWCLGSHSQVEIMLITLGSLCLVDMIHKSKDL